MHKSIADYVSEQQNLVKQYAQQFSVASIAERYFNASNIGASRVFAAEVIAAQSARDKLEEQFASIVKGIAWPDASFSEVVRRQQEQFQETLGSSSAMADAIAAGDFGSRAARSVFDEVQRLDAINAAQSVAMLVDAQDAHWRRTMEPNLYGINQVADSLTAFVTAAHGATGIATSTESLIANAAQLQEQLLRTFGALAHYPNDAGDAVQAANAFYRLASRASEHDIFVAARTAADCFVRGEEVAVGAALLDPAETARIQLAKLFLTILQVWIFGHVLFDATRREVIAIVLCTMAEILGAPNPRTLLHDFLFEKHEPEVVHMEAQPATTNACRPLIALVHTNGGNAKLRATPGARTKVVSFLPDRTSVVVEPGSEMRAGNKIWVRVRAHLGPDDFAEGWIARDLLDVFAIDGVRCAPTDSPGIARASVQ